MTATWVSCIIGAYLLGSIPFGVIIGRSRGIDIRTQGSKNIGATNVGRLLGRRWGLLCFSLDMAKGAVPVVVAGVLADLYDQSIFSTHVTWWLWLAVGTAALLGHMYSIFLRGDGGKGVATTFGALLAIWPIMTIAALAALLVWLIMVTLFRMISLASMVAAVTLPLTVLIEVEVMRASYEVISLTLVPALRLSLAPIIFSFFLAALVIWKHRSNIGRIIAGTERRIGDGSSREAT